MPKIHSISKVFFYEYTNICFLLMMNRQLNSYDLTSWYWEWTCFSYRFHGSQRNEQHALATFKNELVLWQGYIHINGVVKLWFILALQSGAQKRESKAQSKGKEQPRRTVREVFIAEAKTRERKKRQGLVTHKHCQVSRAPMQARTPLHGKPCWCNSWNNNFHYSILAWTQLCFCECKHWNVGLFGMLRVFSFASNTRDCGNALCGQFFR